MVWVGTFSQYASAFFRELCVSLDRDPPMKEVAVSTNLSTETDEQAPFTRKPDVELLALDLATCARCFGTLENIEEAIGMVQRMLDVTGTQVSVRKALIESEEQARHHYFETSPAIR